MKNNKNLYKYLFILQIIPIVIFYFMKEENSSLIIKAIIISIIWFFYSLTINKRIKKRQIIYKIPFYLGVIITPTIYLINQDVLGMILLRFFSEDFIKNYINLFFIKDWNQVLLQTYSIFIFLMAFIQVGYYAVLLPISSSKNQFSENLYFFMIAILFTILYLIIFFLLDYVYLSIIIGIIHIYFYLNKRNRLQLIICKFVTKHFY